MKLFFQFAIVAIMFSSNLIGQDDQFAKDVAKMQKLNGSLKSYDMIFDQMVAQLKATMPDVPDKAWSEIKTEVFDEQVTSFSKKLIPIYQKHFTHEDIKAIIAFYQSETGKKLAEKTPAISQESMVLGQQWGMGLNMAIQQYLRKNGYVDNNPLGQ